MTGAVQPTTVGELMAIDPIVVKANASLDEVAELLDRHHISGLPVVDGSGSLVGVVSQTDLVRARSTQDLWANWPGLAVRHLMTSPAMTTDAGEPKELHESRLGAALPVLDMHAYVEEFGRSVVVGSRTLQELAGLT